MNKFIDRQEELDYLNHQYFLNKSNFIVIYGRRRVGKTTLLREFVKDKPSVFFVADLTNEKIQLERFKQIILQNSNDDFFKNLEITNWEQAFRILTRITDFKQKQILIIDEFQYLAMINSSFPSVLQRIWDELLSNLNIMIVLSGSLISMMYKTALNYKSPLYGRRTGQLHLKPISFRNYSKFFENKESQTKRIEFFSVTGGIPKYLEVLDLTKDLLFNIEHNILNSNSFLYNEPFFLLKEEINQPITYFSILETIAKGNHKLGNIASRLGLKPNTINKYLNVLSELQVIERRVPVTEKFPHKSKKGLYFISDNFIRFWFRFVFPYRNYLETGNLDYVLKIIQNELDRFVSFIFEDIVISELEYLTGLNFEHKGRFWDKNTEIDVVGINRQDKTLLFGECKWQNRVVNFKVLEELKQKASILKFDFEPKQIYYAIFSKSNFSKTLKDDAKQQENILLVNFK